MTTIKELRVIEIYEERGEVLIKKAVNISLIQANVCRQRYQELKNADPSIKGIVFLIELTTIKDLTILR